MMLVKKITLGLLFLALIGTSITGWAKYNGLKYQVAVNNSPASTQNNVQLNELVQKPASPQIVQKYAVPILMYHYIRSYNIQNDPIGIGLSVSPTNFTKQMSDLKNAGYQTISLANFIDGQVPAKPVIITFDDGYSDQFTDALPVLQQDGFTATFFIVHDFIGRLNYMDSTQLAILKADGMELGNHTLDHSDLAILPYLSAYRQIVKANTSNLAPVFAYPSGEYNQQTIAILQSIGEKAAVTTKLGIATDLTAPLELPRLRVTNSTNIIKLIYLETSRLKKAS